MYAFGIGLLVVATALFVLFGPAFLTGGSGTYPLNFDEFYFWAQWAAFWITLASLGIFALNRRTVPMVLAALLIVHFLWRTMPEKSNEDRWVKGAIGFRVYFQTKRAAWEKEHARKQVLAAFSGVWRATPGTLLSIEQERVMLSDQEIPSEFREYTWEPPARLDFLFMRAGMVNSPLRRNLANREYLQLRLASGREESVFVLIEPKRLFAVLDDGSVLLFSKER